jgi:hypothetical protein
MEPKTVFCDVDGTLVNHTGDITKNFSDMSGPLPGVLDSLRAWDRANYRIILTTGRKESTRPATEAQLKAFGIVYDDLIMGLPNGDRVVINDRKTNGVRNTAYAVNVVRNKGLEKVDLASSDVTVPDSVRFMRIEKPWGYEELVECNDKYVVKKLFMKKGNSCSLQYHELKKETIVVLSGVLNIIVGETSREYRFGETVTIAPYTVHRMEAVEDSLYMETSTNELFDVVRLKDAYGRS